MSHWRYSKILLSKRKYLNCASTDLYLEREIWTNSNNNIRDWTYLSWFRNNSKGLADLDTDKEKSKKQLKLDDVLNPLSDMSDD
jgi:hypothetical protein